MTVDEMIEFCEGIASVHANSAEVAELRRSPGDAQQSRKTRDKYIAIAARLRAPIPEGYVLVSRENLEAMIDRVSGNDYDMIRLDSWFKLWQELTPKILKGEDE